MNWFNWLLIALVLLLIPTAYAGKIGAPYAPTRRRVVRKTFDQLNINEDDTLIDLGAGDGSILIEAARRGAKAIGFELSPIMYVIARLRTLRYRGVRILLRNFYKQPLREATVIFAFLMPNNMPKVRQMLNGQQIPNGRFFLSYMFALNDAQPITVIREENCGPIYVYDLQDLTAGEGGGTQ